ncbi:RiPP maturation radical SAM protein 1 [Actinomadura graeca]|uniref:RiPP maturation radical SAM protein 1 n=1 Tax=Actinomadura graeca TaxID=2750812 RepID=A0ABX8QX87_9ACTN|nr:RiPP maturation radical SAM C-methyltransferase [Actinomadura graeca]QXJ23342.1 RiPP maturation radical SAM protein 1 [Actinomadura graeca]
MPWHLVTAPNGAASVLAAALAPDHEVTTYYGSISFAERMLAEAETAPEGSAEARLLPESYMYVAEEGFTGGIGEWLFTGALYGTPRLPAEAAEACAAIGFAPDVAEQIFRLAPAFAADAADAIAAGRPDVVGFTTTFSQTVPALAVARRLRALAPHVTIVFGGSNCDGPMGAALHRNFPEIDYVVRREGEAPLRALLDALAEGDPGRTALQASRIPGLCWRDESVQGGCGGCGGSPPHEGQGGSGGCGGSSPRKRTVWANPEDGRLPGGGDFPPMDQDAYFERLETSPVADYIQPALMMETARGCWWGERHHCTFCGLSDMILPFRSKAPERVVGELLAGVGRHQVLDVLTTDNIVDRTYFDTVFPALEESGLDLRIMYEVKSDLTPAQARALRGAGVVQVQPGIENLHSLPLKLMRKGVTGTGNIATLRELQGQGLTVLWNYLVGFPGETDACYREVIGQIPLLHHLQPPLGAHRIALERFNPYFDHPDMGFAERRPRAWYRGVFPGLGEADLADVAYLFETPDHGIGGAVLAALKAAFGVWRDAYPRSSLTHRSVRGRLHLYDRRAGRHAADHVLDDPAEVAAYAALARGRSPEGLARHLSAAGWRVGAAWPAAFVDDLAALGLVYRESGRAVTLSTEHDATAVRGTAVPTPAMVGAGT